MLFHTYYKKYGRAIHKGNIPARAGFADTLMGYSDAKKLRIFALYTEAQESGQIKKNYRLIYVLFNSTKKQRNKNKLRTRNRRLFESLGLVTKGDGKEIHHLDGNVLNNHRRNLKVISGCSHRRLHGHSC